MKINQIHFKQNINQPKSEETKPEPTSSPRTDGAKALGLSLATLATFSMAGFLMNKPQPVLASPLNKANSSVNLTVDDGNLKTEFIAPKGVNVNIDKMQKPLSDSLNKLSNLKKTDSNYSWIDLPEKLLNEKYVDNVYKTVGEFKKPFKNNPKLIFVALGNPSNGDELVKASGLGSNLVYSCDITPAQVKDTIKKAGGDLENIQVIISSKSGSTFESSQTYSLLNEAFTKYYENKGVKPENIKKEVSKHFLMITDKNPEKSVLKKQAMESGIKTIDAVDGLHSGFGDLAYSLPILAYAGLPEESAVKMLKSADAMTKKLMTNDLNQNMAGKIAAFDKIAQENGATKEQFVFHDAHFTDFSSTMEQLYKESLRKLNFMTSVYPRAAHSGLESDLNHELKGQPISIITNVDVKNDLIPQTAEDAKYNDGAAKLEEAHEISAQNEGHYQKKITLNMGDQGVTPESLGEFITLKSFVAYFKNEFENAGKVDMYKQPYVKGYKEIRVNLSNPTSANGNK